MHRGIWAVKRAHWWTWMKARRLLKETWPYSTLTPARFDVLFVLQQRGRMMQRKLRHVLNVVGSTMSEMLADLEKRGLVVRGARSRAGRSVEISAKGVDAIENSIQAYYCVDDTIGNAFGSWFDESCGRFVLWERVCRRVRHACGDSLFPRAFEWLVDFDE